MTGLLNFFIFPVYKLPASVLKRWGPILNWRDVYKSTVDLYRRRDADEYHTAAYLLCDLPTASPSRSFNVDELPKRTAVCCIT